MLIYVFCVIIKLKVRVAGEQSSHMTEPKADFFEGIIKLKG